MNRARRLTAAGSARDLLLLLLVLMGLAILFGRLTWGQLGNRGAFSVEWDLVDVRENDRLLILAVERYDPEGKSSPLHCGRATLQIRAVDFANSNVMIEITGYPTSESDHGAAGSTNCTTDETRGVVEVELPRPLGDRPIFGCRQPDCEKLGRAGYKLNWEVIEHVVAQDRRGESD